jgi:hypothetical protein
MSALTTSPSGGINAQVRDYLIIIAEVFIELLDRWRLINNSSKNFGKDVLLWREIRLEDQTNIRLG